nr:DUF4260 domain-containing protein [Devosia submarina]
MTSIYSEATQPRLKTMPKPIKQILQLEGALVLVLAMWGFAALGGNWWLFALLFLAPDLFMLGYTKDKRLGAAVYNLGHTYLTPAALALVGTGLGWSAAVSLALIWAGHIGLDRMLGFGLKRPDGFKKTHLG